MIRKRVACRRIGISVLLLLLLWMGRSLAETTGETVTGYFEDHNYLRPRMEQTTDYVDVIPPYTIVTLDVIDRTWSLYTSPKGKTGYINYTRILPVPEYEREPERYVYSDKRIQVRTLPHYEAPTVYTAGAWELLTVDGHLGKFEHVVAEDGTGGYIMPGWARRAEFTPKAIAPVTLCVAEKTRCLDMPLQGAHPTGSLEPESMYRADGVYENYYALTADGRTVYVEKEKTVLCTWRGGENRTFFRMPRTGAAGRTDAIEEIFTNGLTAGRDPVLYRADGTAEPIPGGSRIYVYTGYGDWLGVSMGEKAGYLHRKDVQILSREGLTARLREQDLSGASVQRNEFLDQAFAMVEEGNPFQARYNLLTGADIRSVLPLGIPYFWGGRNYRTTLERLPLYTTREAWQSSRVYYQKGTIYLYGFDCIGFVKNVYSLAGKPIIGTVVGHGAEEYCQAGQHIYCDKAHPLPEDWTEAARTMQAGDIMVIHHPGTHAMMYMGTLREFGYTEEQLPALAKYLDHPLMLQSGENPYSYLRFRSMIESSSDPRTAGAAPTDGGVGVCILGVDREDAEMVIECHDTVSRCFDVEGSCVTIMGFGNVADYFVYRMGAEQPEVSAAEEAEADETEAAGDEETAEEAAADETEASGAAGSTETAEEAPAGETEASGAAGSAGTAAEK